jgi:hypothetical protein
MTDLLEEELARVNWSVYVGSVYVGSVYVGSVYVGSVYVEETPAPPPASPALLGLLLRRLDALGSEDVKPVMTGTVIPAPIRSVTTAAADYQHHQ